MNQTGRITYNSRDIGELQLSSDLVSSQAVVTADGFRIDFEGRLTLHPSIDETRISIDNLRGVLRGINGDSSLDLGTLSCDGEFSSFTHVASAQVFFTWRAHVYALRRFEKLRNGGPARLRFEIRGNISHQIQTDFHYAPLRTQSTALATAVEVSYSNVAWAAVLRAIAVTDLVLVEIPMSAHSNGEWQSIWQAFEEARQAIEHGGPSGSRNCVFAIRRALEEWGRVEKYDEGTGVKPQERSWAQRVDLLRRDLHNCAHLGAHTSAEKWTEAEARLLYTSFAALLSYRRPS